MEVCMCVVLEMSVQHVYTYFDVYMCTYIYVHIDAYIYVYVFTSIHTRPGGSACVLQENSVYIIYTYVYVCLFILYASTYM